MRAYALEPGLSVLDAQPPEGLSDGVSERWGDNMFLKMSKRYPNRIYPSMIRGKMHAGRFCCELTALQKKVKR
jgi:hypothetical protein